MPILARRRLNGVPMGTIVASGTAPSNVSSFAAGTPTSTTIPLTYAAPNGTAPITYAGFTSIHGAASWTQNTGSFGATSGTFVGLAANTTYDFRVVATNQFGSSTTDLLTGITTLAAPATTFLVSLSRASGASGTPVVMTVSPVSGPWPSGQVVVSASAGIAGSFDNTSLVGAGSAAVSFTFTPTSNSGSSGTLSATASGMMNRSGPQSYSTSASTTSMSANRFDITMGNSAVAAGSTVQVTVYPNAGLPSGSITLSGTNGSFSPSPTITLSRGSSSPVTVTYTPATSGEHAITATNSANLYNPYSAPLTVFAPASGKSQSISAALTRGDLVTFQRNSANGNPAGFFFLVGKGLG